MTVRANPRLIEELERFGAQDVVKCYHCGDCSAVCPFSKQPFVFPRRTMRSLQLGLEERLLSSLEPWLCYYCGDCSEQCPSEAEPGETMMGMRRWLTARYDVTGIARRFRGSWAGQAALMLAVGIAAAIVLVVIARARGGSFAVYDGPGAFVETSVLRAFLATLLAAGLALLVANGLRMWWLTTGRRIDARASLYVREAWRAPYHFATQQQMRECTRERPWFVHLVVMYSVLVMFVLGFGFAPLLRGGPAAGAVHAFGYAAALGAIGGVSFLLAGRLRRREVQYRHSHGFDWMFLALLLAVAASGLAVHVARIAGSPALANALLVAHVAVLAPLFLVEIPLGKWGHMLYRPLAQYFAAVHIRLLESRGKTA